MTWAWLCWPLGHDRYGVTDYVDDYRRRYWTACRRCHRRLSPVHTLDLRDLASIREAMS